MFRFVSNDRRGFTIVELLVVISIIGILLTILYANFSQAKMQSRDKVRKAELKEIQLAVELYKAQNSTYPAALSALTPDFIQEVPTDPSGGSYTYNSDGSSYKVMAEDVEALYITSFNDEFSRCPRQGTNCPNVETIKSVYAVYSVGAEDW
jgi:general secretion pathway protein G